ncbi:tetratricopeptide repeat protein [Streptomyces griseorubiginosus]|nr:tetratricopeptide repeat protein [Streptomyces griseorubiginosus]
MGPRARSLPYGCGGPGAQIRWESGYGCAKVRSVNQDWEDRVAAAWAAFDDYAEDDAGDFRAVIDALAAELPEDSPLGLFERACAWDSTGHSDKAVPLYREALDRGLSEVSRYKGRRAKIQLSSSLRNIGQAEEGVKLLTPELDGPSDELDDAVRACLALCLSSLGRDREGLSLVLGALAPHLPRYQRSMANYARLLVEPGE